MIILKPMSETEFCLYEAWAIPHYASEKQKGENLSEEDAMKVAVTSFQKILPQKEKTPYNYLYQAFHQESEKAIGILWLAKKTEGMKTFAYIYDVLIYPEFRGQRLGEELMKMAFEEAKKLGVSSISLHVFGNNERAINLYKKLGFQSTNIIMAKDL